MIQGKYDLHAQNVKVILCLMQNYIMTFLYIEKKYYI